MSSYIYDPHRIRQKSNRYYQRKGQILRCKDVKYKTVCATKEDAEKYKQAVRIYFPEKYYSSIFMTKTKEVSSEELKDGDLIYFSLPWSDMEYKYNSWNFKQYGTYLVASDYGLVLPDDYSSIPQDRKYVIENNSDLLVFNGNEYKETNGNNQLKVYGLDSSGQWGKITKTFNENFKFAYYYAETAGTLKKVSGENIITFTSEPQKYPD